MSRGPRTCPICGKTFNWIDWTHHEYEHMSEEEKDDIRAQLREKYKPKPRQTAAEEAEMWRKLALGDDE